MADTKIEWCDKVWNPVVGCTKCSPGCLNCYAERMAWRLRSICKSMMDGRNQQYLGKTDNNGHWTGQVECCDWLLDEPFDWHKPKRIFVCSMSDLFHEKVPFYFFDKVFTTMTKCPHHIFQVLTKRPKRMKEFFDNYDTHSEFLTWPKPNIHLGVSISTQSEADEKIPILLQIPATVRWLSIEPMLEGIDILKYLWVRQKCVGEKGCGFTGASYEFDNPKNKSASRCPQCGKNHTYLVTDSIDWVVVGCESGPKNRPCKIEWIQSIVDQCQAEGVPVYVKQININGKVVKMPEEFTQELPERS